MMDDYYTLLGVDPDAPTEDIRTAYREKKAALTTKNSDAGKADAARLNKAWNVLSDPYQRGRYDEQRSKPDDNGDGGDGDEDGAVTATRRPAERPRGQTPRRSARELPPPTIELPVGTSWPDTKRRITAMVIDLTVLLVLFIGSQFTAQAIAHSSHKATVDRINALRDDIDNAHKQTTTLNKRSDAAASKAKASHTTSDQQAANQAKAAATAAKKHETRLTDEYNSEQDKLKPLYNTTIGLFFLVGLLYLVVPSGISGRTMGKRIQHLKVLRQDGSKLRWADALIRYGILGLATYGLSFFLGPLSALLVLVAVTTWMRNPNRQGLHDRLAKTIVVAENNP
jgi:curved DNA-binding protein CbpA